MNRDEIPAEVAELSETSSESASSGRPSQATLLVGIAEREYQFGHTVAGEALAVPRAGPLIARPFSGGRSALRAELALQFYREYERAAGTAALASALNVLQGRALVGPTWEPALRVAKTEDGIVFDLGRQDGQVVRITGVEWTIENTPVLFRRTQLSGEMPVPERGGSLGDLKALVNVAEDLWPVVVGYLVAALIADIPHPILAFLGEQGTGKSTVARLLVGLIDGGPVPLRTAPRDVEQWCVQAAGSWVVVLDNISNIRPWLSDGLCRASTGDGLVRRQLYTDTDLSVVNFRRCIVLTSIDPGALRGDLADRLLLIELSRIPTEKRKLDEDLMGHFRSKKPRMMGALFDLASGVMRELPEVNLGEYPRMADFAKVLAALDRVTGWDALPTYMAMTTSIASQVVEGDPVAKKILDLVEAEGEWHGTASELLERISNDDERHPRGWPTTPSAMGAALRRVAPALRQEGIEVEYGEHAREGGTGRRLIWFSRNRCSSEPSQPSQVSRPSLEDTAVGDGSDRCDGKIQLPFTDIDQHEFEERAAIREYDGEMSRKDAERLAMEDLK